MVARVLIIEDNPINLELLDYLLLAYGFNTLRAGDGALGFDIACLERPDLILCDIQMPGMGGIEFARRVRQHPQLQGTPLVAVTALAMVGDRDRIVAQGFDGYIAKPINPHELVDTLSAFLPVDKRPGTEAPRSPSATVVPAPGRTTILVVDDTAFNLELKRDLLQPHGYEVLTASNAEQGWQLASKRLPRLIISDVGMASGSGFDFIRRIKADARLRAIPFMFLSSTHWDEASVALGLQLGALRYLRRPLEPQVLLAEIRACLGG